MKKLKNEKLCLILSLILIVFCVSIYLFFGRMTNSSETTNTDNTVAVSTSSSTAEEFAQNLVAEVEANPTADTLTNAQNAINSITDETSKNELQARLDAVSSELTNEASADTAVATAESSLSSDDVATAQAIVDTLTNEDVKASLQARLDAVTAEIATYYTDTTTYDDYNSQY